MMDGEEEVTPRNQLDYSSLGAQKNPWQNIQTGPLLQAASLVFRQKKVLNCSR